MAQNQAKRAYGDWSSPNLKGWKDKLLEQSIQPIQQFAYAQGKNATGSAMIIDAMDLLHSSRYDGFCLASSDSDFTRIAARIRESGFTVYGSGEQKIPKPLVVACDKLSTLKTSYISISVYRMPRVLPYMRISRQLSMPKKMST